MSRRCELILVVAAIVLGHAPAALALPTMIRLGYTGCATCHFAPQGGGPLNPYGKSIDEAQSLRGGEYRPRDTRVILYPELEPQDRAGPSARPAHAAHVVRARSG